MQFNVSPKRIYFLIGFFVVALILIFFRLLYLQIIDAPNKSQEAIDSRTISYNTKPRRGSIYDRNGNVLAYSENAITITANPAEITNDKEVASIIAKHLGGTSDYYLDLIKNKESKFAYIKRREDVDVANLLKEEKVTGLYFEDDQKRMYPYGRVAGQIIGCINVDGDGLCGLESYYDDILRGYSGSTIKQQGNKGMPIPGGVLQEKAVINGQDIMLSIDIEIQQYLENVLESYCPSIGCTSMHSIIMDPTTGDIFAAASLPLFNPADVNSAQPGATDLKCISTSYEPGSTFKSVAAMSIFENNILTPDSQIFCPSQIEADGFVVKDAHDRESVTYTFRQIMEQSSNVGISLSNERQGWDKYYDKLCRYEINERTGIDYPGDYQGYILDFNRWSRIHGYNISFGQGVSMTPLQTSKFYCALANNGVEVKPHFLLRYLQSDEDEKYDSKDIIDNKEALATMNDVLKSVVTNGTGRRAQIEGFEVAGKTGTGEIGTESGAYLTNVFYDSFVGYITNGNIPMLCFVGGEKAPQDTAVTECWHQIMTFVIERLKIAKVS